MKRMLSVLVFLSSLAFGSTERNHENFYYLSSSKMTTQSSGVENVVVAFDPETSEFIWKDYSEGSKNEWQVISKDALDPLFFDVKTLEDVKTIDVNEGTYYKLRKLGNDEDYIIGLDLNFRIRGGGPIAAGICGAVCKVIGAVGCIGGTILLLPNPALSAVYAAVCSALDTGGTLGCITVCLTLPTP